MNLAQADRACERCRARRVKCDKSLPGCQRCSKLGQQCPGYPEKRTFFDDGAKIRKKLKMPDKPIIELAPTISHTQLQTENTNIASDVPDHNGTTMSTVEQPFSDHQTSIAMLLGDFDHNFLDDDIVLSPLESDNFFDLDLETYYANGNNACGFIPGVPAILSNVDGSVLDELASPDTWSQSRTRLNPPPLDPEVRHDNNAVGRDSNQETATLLHHFVELMAPIMDIYDTNAYFGRIVPLKAASNIMLRSAIAAVAAKRIALRLQQSLSSMERTESYILTSSSHSTSRDMDSSQWFYRAASHYDKGLAFLRIQLQHLSTLTTVDPSSPEAHTDTPLLRGDSIAHNAIASHSSPRDVRAAQVEDLLTAISILTLYEDHDTSSANLSQHLDGLKSLFGQSIQYYGTKSNSPLAVFDPRRGGHAALWYCAHQDIYSAYIHRSPTRLDPKDIQLWNVSGLCPSLISASFQATVDGIEPFFDPRWCENEHAASQGIIWLTLKVINFITPQEYDSESQHSISVQEGMLSPGPSPNGSSRSIYSHDKSREWALLHKLLQEWYNNLPIIFRPYVRIPLDLNAKHESSLFEKILFSMPMVAAAMQMYHFAQILLLLNRPLDQEHSLNPSKRLRIFQQSCRDAIYHGRQICGIALGNTHLSVKKQMIPSLHLSGLCFDKDSDRKVVLDILRDFNADTNLSTERKIQELRSEWGWNADQHDVTVQSMPFEADHV